MRSKSGAYGHVFPPLKVYREDLERLVSIFQQYGQDVSIGDERHLYKSLGDLVQHSQPKLRSFHLYSSSPDAHLAIRTHRSSLRLIDPTNTILVKSTGDAARAYSLYRAVKDFLDERKWTYKQTIINVLAAVGLPLLIVSLISKIVGPLVQDRLLSHLLALAGPTGTICLLFAFGTIIRGISCVSLESRTGYVTIKPFS